MLSNEHAEQKESCRGGYLAVRIPFRPDRPWRQRQERRVRQGRQARCERHRPAGTLEAAPGGQEAAAGRDEPAQPDPAPDRPGGHLAARPAGPDDERARGGHVLGGTRAEPGRAADQPVRRGAVRRRLHHGHHRRRREPHHRAAEPGAGARPGRGDRRRGPRFLLRARHLDQGHRAGGGQRRPGRLHPGWFHHHPAVRQERLPQLRPDAEPQAQGAGDLAQAEPGVLQGPDPGELPQHHLLRPWRLRCRSRRQGLLRGVGRQGQPRPGGTAGSGDQVTGVLRPGGHPGGGQGPLAVRGGRHGQHRQAQPGPGRDG